MAPGSIGRGSEGPSYQVYSSESTERSGGQGKREGQEAEAYRREKEEKMDGVPPTTTEQDTSREHHSLGGH